MKRTSRRLSLRIRELSRSVVSVFGLSEFRTASLTLEIGRSLKFAVPSFYNENRYASKTSQCCSSSWVVSASETRAGISSLLVKIYVAQYGPRRVFSTWLLGSRGKSMMRSVYDLEIWHKCLGPKIK